jgi:carbamoylphosphate synthase small subunit
MKAATITVKQNEYGRIILSTHNGDYTVDEDTANAIKELIDDCDWQEF